MSKKISILISILGFAFFLGSCSDSDNNNTVSQEWIDYQEDVYYNTRDSVDTSGKKLYTSLASMSGDGYVYHKESDYITNIMEKGQASTRVTEDGKPDVTDEVEVRYEGWFLDMDGNKVIFDTTEKGNNVGVPAKKLVRGFVDGFADVLQDMKPGEERIVCIPNYLAYGSTGFYSGNTLIVPPYTTLYFDVKLLKVIG